MAVTVPANFTPREYQKALYNAPAQGFKRGVVVWHRRAGKDKVFMAMLAKAAIQRPGVYFYILPYYKQARKAIWEGIDSSGSAFLSVFPPEIITKKDNQEMILRLINGSIIYFLGSDNIDSILGTNPVGIFFSEFSLHKPQVWDFLRPILLENNGFAFFNGTPRGRNHLYTMYQAAQNDPLWFHECRGIDSTNVVTEQDVEDEIRNGMARATARQEFYCSFDAALQGAYYEEPMNAAAAAGQHCVFTVDPYVPAVTAWDIGIRDTTVIIIAQRVAHETRIVDCIANSGKGLDYYVGELKKRRYNYVEHFLPHDIREREVTNGKSRLNTLYDLGLNNVTANRRSSIEDGINATRRMLYSTYIHSGNCLQLIEALKTYRAEYDEVKQVYGNPIHDWSSHYADAVRQLAVGMPAAASKDLPTTALGADYEPVKGLEQSDVRGPVYKRWKEAQRQDSDSGNSLGFTSGPGWDPRAHTHADPFYNIGRFRAAQERGW